MSDKISKRRKQLWQQMDQTQRYGFIFYNVLLWTAFISCAVIGFFVGGESIGSALISAILLGGLAMFAVGIYFIPYLVAYYRCHSSSTAILVANLIFGFTGLGWIICLIVSLIGKQTKIEVDL